MEKENTTTKNAVLMLVCSNTGRTDIDFSQFNDKNEGKKRLECDASLPSHIGTKCGLEELAIKLVTPVVVTKTEGGDKKQKLKLGRLVPLLFLVLLLLLFLII